MLNSFSNRVYELDAETTNKKTTSIKLIVCGQIVGVVLFLVGLVVGLCIGIFVFHHHDSSLAHTSLGGQQELHGTKSLSRTKLKDLQPDTGKTTVDKDDTRVDSSTDDSNKPEIPAMEQSGIQSLVSSCKKCVWNNPIRKPRGPNLFAPLSAEEMVLVYKTLLHHGIIDVQFGEEISFKSNFVSTMFIHPPPKNATLHYLDAGGKYPGRYATAVVIRGNIENKDYVQYQVGPLDRGKIEVKISQLLKDGEVPYENRPYDNVEIGEIILFVLAELEKMTALLHHSFDVHDVYQDVTVMPNGPYKDGTGRTSRFTLGLRGLGDKEFDFLNILPFTGRIYHGGQDTSEWYTYDFFYLNQGPFSNASEIMESYFNGHLIYVQYPEGFKSHITKTTLPIRNVHRQVRPNSQFPGTSTYEPHGPRYEITGHSVGWLGWSFTVSTGQHRGPAIFDVRFRGERIVYENSLNEIALVYSTDGNGQDNMVFLDSVYGLGESKRAIPRVDCPVYASYLNSTGWNPRGLSPVSLPTFCVFEVNAQEPLWRHKGHDLEGGLNNNFLVARYPTQVGNYDYIVDFQFYLDGRIKTLVSATGFIQGSFWNHSSSAQTPFGYKVSDTLIGPIHDHTFGFKVDLDIAGKENDFQLIHWKSGNVESALKNKKDPSNFFYNHTRFIEWEHIDRETGLNIHAENQNFWTVVNKNQKNIHGVDRGYRIIPMATSSQNLPDDYPRMRELSFTKYHCAITKQKDNEQYLKPLYFPVPGRSINDTSPTQLYLDDMINDEMITNEDIVTWLSVGFLHIPTSEDVPMTIRVETGFTLKPHNFFDTTATFDIPSLAVFNKTVFDNAPVPDMCFSEPFPVVH